MRHRYKKSLIVIIILGLIMVCLYYSGLGSYFFSLEKLKVHSGALKVAVAQNYVHSVVVFILLYILLIAFTLPVVAPLTLIGGYLFGLLPGFFYSLIGSTLGSTCSFLLIRYALSSLLRDKYKEQLVVFQEKVRKHGSSYLLTLQLLSVFPFVVINTLAALTDVSLLSLFATTLLGSAPLIFIYAWAGKQLGNISSIHEIISPQLLIIFLLLALISLLPILFKKWTSKE